MGGRDVGVDKAIWLGPIRMSDFDTDSLNLSFFYFPFILLFYYFFVLVVVE
jgi:hypothetical protein